MHFSAGKRDRGKSTPGSRGRSPLFHRTGGGAPCSMKGRKTRLEEKVFKEVIIHDCVYFKNWVSEKLTFRGS